MPRINDRHYVSRIKPNAPVKDRTTYIPPDLETTVASELIEIVEGRATRSEGNRYIVASGRVYVDEGNDVFFPMSGPGLIGPVNRGTNRALTILARYNGPSEQAMKQIRLEKGIQPDDVETAMWIWSLLERDQESPMFYWTDLHLERNVDDRPIVRALAKAFGVTPHAVAVVGVNDEALTAWDRPGLQVFAQWDNLDRGGEEFPVTLMITIRQEDDLERPLDKVRAIATELGVAIMTDVETEGDCWRLVMPDGHDRLVVNDDAAESRGELALRQSDREALERHRAAHVA